MVTMGKEAYDDYCRYLRDREANSTRYLVLLPRQSGTESDSLTHPQTRSTPASSIKVGDMVLLEKNQRVPADMVLLTTSEEEGTCFIRTDQLDGETDWKLKVAVAETQKMGEKAVGNAEGSLYGTDALELSLSHANSQPTRPSRTSTLSTEFSPCDRPTQASSLRPRIL
jgi:phospholipid-translocating ATPase